MSFYNNEYIISSNNSMNDNKYNSQKASKTHKIKSILKPLLKMLKKKQQQPEKYYCHECEDNSANEELENQLFDEITSCHPNSAIFVCDEGQWNVKPITKSQAFVPVHFARTEAGTFFWTSMTKSEDSDFITSRQCFTQCQEPMEQIPIFTQDRWVQA